MTSSPTYKSLVFTICSNNYLAHAKTLCDSLYALHPELKILIGLVDKKHFDIDYSFFNSADILELNENIIPGYEYMISRYNIIELNTAVKPFLFQFLIHQHPEIDCIFYFDPDIRVYNSIHFLSEQLQNNAILLTPHFYTPIEIDGKHPLENVALNYGIYNLGFLGLQAKHTTVMRFLKWWSERTFKLGYARPQDGLFVDQLWINLVPIFFGDTHVLSHYGCNMAPWNLHERDVDVSGDPKMISLTNGDPLVFYHFSSFDYRIPAQLTKYYNRYNFENKPSLKKLYEEYYRELLMNKIILFSAIKCGLPVIDYAPKMKHRVMMPMFKLLQKLWRRI